jgi:hypothetical protein
VRDLLCERWHCDPLRVEFIKQHHPDIFGQTMEVLRIAAQEHKDDPAPGKRGTEPDPDFATAAF